MGVTHKLKSEVIEFILNLKKSSPETGCRELARITSEKFQLNVSKSSISTILKNSNLSSPVGRPVQDPGKKGFAIPEEKKKQIHESFSKIAPEKKIEHRQPNKVQEKPKEKISTVEPFLSTEDVLPLIPDPANNPQTQSDNQTDEILKKIQGIRKTYRKESAVRYNDIGTLFLKYAFDDFRRSFNLKTLLNKYSRGQIPTDFDDLLSAVYLEYVFKLINSNKKVLKMPIVEKELPVLLQFDTQARFESLRAMPSSRIMSIEFSLLEKQFLQATRLIRIVFNNKSEIVMDAQLGLFWDDKLKFERPALFSTSLDLVSKSLISNVRPLVLNFAQNIFSLPQSFSDLLSVLNAQSSTKIKEVKLESTDGVLQANLDIIPSFARRFLIGLSPVQAQAVISRQAQKWLRKDIYYHNTTDRIFYYTDARAKCIDATALEGLRVITIYEEKEKREIFCILSNMINKEPQELLNQFLARWPDLFSISPFMLSDRAALLPKQLKSKSESTHKEDFAFGIILERYFEEAFQYFMNFYLPKTSEPSENILKEYLDLKGYFVDTGEGRLLTVEYKDHAPYWDELSFTIQRLNESMYDERQSNKTFLTVSQI